MDITTNQEKEDYPQINTSLEINDLKNSKSRYSTQELVPFSKVKENTAPNFHKPVKSNELIKKTQDALNSLSLSRKVFPDYISKDNTNLYESKIYQIKNENKSNEKLKFSKSQTQILNKYEENEKNSIKDIIKNEKYKDKNSKTNKNFRTVDYTNNKYSINTEIISHKTLDNTNNNINISNLKSRMKKVNSNDFYFNYKNNQFFDNVNTKQTPPKQKSNNDILKNYYKPEDFEKKLKNINNNSTTLYKLYNNSNIDDITMNSNNKSCSSFFDSISFNRAEEEEKKMLIRIEDEEKKLIELENEKNKLINEEKERRKIISHSIEKQNRKNLKKMMKLNKYQNEQKLRNIFLQQEKNKNEIQQLINNKIQDEEKLNKLENQTSYSIDKNLYNNNFIEEYKFNDGYTKLYDGNTKYNDDYKYSNDKLNTQIKINDDVYKYNDNNSKFNDDYLKEVKALQEKNNLINQKSKEIFKKMEIPKNLDPYSQYSQKETINKTDSQTNISFKDMANSLNKKRPKYRQKKSTNMDNEDNNLMPINLTPNGFYRNNDKKNSYNYYGSYSQSRNMYKRSNTQKIPFSQNMKTNSNKNYLMTSIYNINNGGDNNNNHGIYYQDYSYFNKYNTNPYNNLNNIYNNYRTEDIINSNYSKNYLKNNNNYDYQYSFRRKSYGNFQDIIDNNDYFKIMDHKNKSQRNFNNKSNAILEKTYSTVIGEKKNVIDNQNELNSAFAPWYNSNNNSHITTCENCNEEKEVYGIDNMYKNNYAENGNYNTYNDAFFKLCPHCNKEL